ncbi:MAG: putative dehydrogenase [Neolewinella sp.]|jgi:predicted dehydrogenase
MKRRQFLATAPALLLSSSCLHPRAVAQMSARPKVALIGAGWYGRMDLLRLLQVAEVEVVGLCDPDQQQLEDVSTLLQQRHPGQQPRVYAKHEDLLAKEKPEMVLIESPDHWHTLQAIDCLKAGCHLYLQKPISKDIREGEAILVAARNYPNQVIQVALQRRSTPHLQEMKKRYIDSGLLGEVHHVEMNCYYHMRDQSVRETIPVPESFDYNRWTGPAPLLPFKGVPHRRWRAFEEYSNGIVGDMCVHYYDAVRWLLDLGWPAKVSSQGGIYVQTAADATTNDTQTAVFEHPERKLNCHWTHRSWGQAPDPEWPWSFTLFGEKGTLIADTKKYEWRPAKGDPVRVDMTYEREQYPEDLTEKNIELHVAPATRAHLRNWVESIQGKATPAASLEQGHISTASCILANLSCSLGRPLAYDPVAKVVRDDQEATKLLAKGYREGWGRP